MTGPEIKAKIDANNNQISMVLNPNQFTLNKEVELLLKENVALQKKCPHKFDNGYCIFCQRKEGT